MREPEQFDAFYREARERLLVQTYALTGDLAASRRAVRDAFVHAWHHWRKYGVLDDPESVVRPHAWRLAQRRHTARVWHRERGVDPEARRILASLGKLSVVQRKALLLTQLAAVSMPQMARELGLPLERAEQELQAGASRLSLLLDVPSATLRNSFEHLAGSVGETVRWPRVTIIRRAGSTRRRTHTAVGAATAVAALVVSGSAVTDAAGLRPSLDRPGAARSAQSGQTDEREGSSEAQATGGELSGAAPPILPKRSMLPAATFGRAFPAQQWRVRRTGDNHSGNGIVVPCQERRYADPDGAAALVRVFERRAGQAQSAAGAGLLATQLTEASERRESARRTYRAMASWFAGCDEPRMQLLDTQTVPGVGDQALHLMLRSSKKPVTTYAVGIARTGRYTTTTVTEVPGAPAVDRTAAASVLADAVDGLCELDGAGSCADGSRVEPRAPLRVDSSHPALLSELDLPPVSGVKQPWVGTKPRKARTNDAASACDQKTSFNGRFDKAKFRHTATRTFVIPQARLPEAFGLTETVGALPRPQAVGFVDKVRSRLAGCEERQINAEVTELFSESGIDQSGDTTVDGWRVDVEVSDERTVTFWMAVLRNGTAVGQVGFVPGGDRELPPDAFRALAFRAAERLGRLPKPRR